MEIAEYGDQGDRLKPKGSCIWLIDATTYRRPVPATLAARKERFFRLETLSRLRRIGPRPSRGDRSYSGGLLQLANLLRESGHEVRYLTSECCEDFLERADDYPDVIGFGAVTPTVPLCARLADQFRARFPKVRIVLGGPHAAAAPEQTRRRFPTFDAVVSSRGHEAAETLGTLQPGVQLHPDYDFLPRPLREYGINLMTAEGCPFQCRYCLDRVVPKSLGSLDGGLDAVMKRLPERSPVHYCDSVLGGTSERAQQVCQHLARLDHRLTLSCDLRPEFLDRRLVRALPEAGFVEVRIGMDSADPRVLGRVSRTALPDRVMRSLALVRENSNLYVSVYLLSGLPGSGPQSGEANRETVFRLLREGWADQIKHHLFVPYPSDHAGVLGSEIQIFSEDWSAFDRNSFPTYRLPFLTEDQIWDDFLETEAFINVAWAGALGVSEAAVDTIPLTDDYNVRVYLESTCPSTSGLNQARETTPCLTPIRNTLSVRREAYHYSSHQSVQMESRAPLDDSGTRDKVS